MRKAFTPPFLPGSIFNEGRAGFTLVELIIVVIIIGILASIAIPQFSKTMERSRIAEASAVLGALRGAQLRYKLENTDYTTSYLKLDIDLPNYDSSAGSPNGKFFTYNVANAAEGITATTIATAQRKSSEYGQYILNINDQGRLYCAGSDCAGFVSQ